jgi:dephospho-CoA kinase
MIIALIGEKLAGKDTVAEYLIEQHGAHHVKFSQILDEVLYVLNLEISRDNEIALVTALRSAFGNDVLMKSLVKKAKDTTVPIILINGVRYPEELESLKKLKAKLIYITAPLDLRYQRFMRRKEKSDDAMQTEQEFKDQETAVTEKFIKELGKKADATILNTGTQEELQGQVEKILRQFHG